MNSEPAIKAVPTAVWFLGLAGLLPFLGLTLLLSGAWPAADVPAPLNSKDAAVQAQLTYAAIILSFMGGVQWGLSMRSPAGHGRGANLGYVVSVLPALIAWFALMLTPPAVALIIMAAGFCALFAFDLMTVRTGVSPVWYPALRFPLTVVVTLSLIVSAYLVSV